MAELSVAQLGVMAVGLVYDGCTKQSGDLDIVVVKVWRSRARVLDMVPDGDMMRRQQSLVRWW